MKADGALIGIAETPVQVRNRERCRPSDAQAGSFMRSDLPIAGFAGDH